MQDTYNDHNFNSNSSTNDYNKSEYTDAEIAEHEAIALRQEINRALDILAKMKTIENTPLFRVEGLDPSQEMEYLKLREALYRKLHQL